MKYRVNYTYFDQSKMRAAKWEQREKGLSDNGGGFTLCQKERLECIIPKCQHTTRTLNELHRTI